MTTGEIDHFERIEKKRTHAVVFLVVSLLTVLLALLTMITANRLSALQTQHEKTLVETAVSDADSLKTMHSELESTGKALIEEKKRNDELKKKLAAAGKELKTVKGDLINAQKRLADFQTGKEKAPVSVDPSPSPNLTDEGFSTSATNG